MIENMVEVRLPEPDNFLKVKETLTRIGIASRRERKLVQSCHILHKRGKYYIAHFKEMFMLDGRESNFSEEDVARRNTIANLLSEWGLVEIVNPAMIETPRAPMSSLAVLPYAEKKNWTLDAKYTVGKRQ